MEINLLNSIKSFISNKEHKTLEIEFKDFDSAIMDGLISKELISNHKSWKVFLEKSASIDCISLIFNQGVNYHFKISLEINSFDYAENELDETNFINNNGVFRCSRITINNTSLSIYGYVNNGKILSQQYFFPIKVTSNILLSKIDSETEKYIPTKKDTHNYDHRKNCYIATLAYGDINHPKVELFRGFRDNTLTKNQFGRTFIKYYYRYSPRLVKMLEPYKILNKIIKFFLDVMLRLIK